MDIRKVDRKDKSQFNTLALHPLQSWEWGEFRLRTGIETVRLGRYDKNQLTETAQITIHPIPFSSYTIGYFPKSGVPSEKMMEELINVGKKYKCIFIKLEPQLSADKNKFLNHNSKFLIRISPHPLFTKYTFQLDLTKSEEELLKNMHRKTRYNIKVAEKHGVKVTEDNSDGAFNEYLKLSFETIERQKFYAHTENYHRLMWETLGSKNKELGIKNDDNRLTAHLLTAKYENKILVTWIVFLFNNILYYPYGASSSEYRNVMASNLMMWKAILWGKENGAKLFDMWGALGPNPDPKDPWYGFHRFKEGYGAKLVEFAGSYDLIINKPMYSLYNVLYKGRQILLNLKTYLPR